MLLTPEIIDALDRSVLCWLATAAADGQPNVSPKEAFTHFGADRVIIANIASPGTVRNIRVNPRVCLSCIDIFVQKGYQLKGWAEILDVRHEEYPAMEEKLLVLTGGLFPFDTITCIQVERAKPILAPRYLLYPDTTEAEQIARARQSYGMTN